MAAVDKGDVLSDNAGVFAAEYQTMEGHINEALKTQYPARQPVTVSAQGVSKFVREKLIAAYKHAGWDVRLVPDDRDGDFFQFN
jgi:hypothetical protein